VYARHERSHSWRHSLVHVCAIDSRLAATQLGSRRKGAREKDATTDLDGGPLGGEVEIGEGLPEEGLELLREARAVLAQGRLRLVTQVLPRDLLHDVCETREKARWAVQCARVCVGSFCHCEGAGML